MKPEDMPITEGLDLSECKPIDLEKESQELILMCAVSEDDCLRVGSEFDYDDFLVIGAETMSGKLIDVYLDRDQVTTLRNKLNMVLGE